MTIDTATSLYGILGHPVRQSLSPAIHNPEFAAAGHNAVYLAFDVPPARLQAAIDGARALGIRGLNLTVPHKEAVLPMLDDVDQAARRIGAVNTIVAGDGHLTGFNTDGTGFIGPLSQRLGYCAAGGRALFLGAGGAVRAVAFALADAGAAELVLTNRTQKRAERLAETIARACPSVRTRVVPWREPFADDALAECDLLVQGTSRGLATPPPEIDWARLNVHAIVADLVYRPDGPTRFLAEAAQRGHRIHDGVWMLIGQANEAFRLWTGQRFDAERVARRLRPDL